MTTPAPHVTGAMPPGAASAPPLPHDIRGLVPYATPWWQYLLAALAAAAVFAAVWWLYRRWRTRRPRGAKAAAVSPWAVLRQRLERLSPAAEFPPGRPQEDYFYGLSLLLREGIELRTRIPATDLTLQELKEPLRRKLPLPPPETNAVLAFLERADLVKFASLPSDRAEAEACWRQVGAWLKALEPRAGDLSPLEAAKQSGRASAEVHSVS